MAQKLAGCRGLFAGPVIANNASFDLTDIQTTLVDSTHYGLLIIGVPTDSATAVFRLDGGSIVVVSANTLFTTSAFIPNKYYCYFDVDGYFKVENKVGNGKEIRMSLFGLELRT